MQITQTGGAVIGQHSSTPKTSPEKVAVDKVGALGGEKEDTSIIQAHGKTVLECWKQVFYSAKRATVSTNPRFLTNF